MSSPCCTRCGHCATCELTPLPSSKLDRKSTRLNSSHSQISYAVFCLKKKKAKLVYAWPCVMRIYAAHYYCLRTPTCLLESTDTQTKASRTHPRCLQLARASSDSPYRV